MITVLVDYHLMFQIAPLYKSLPMPLVLWLGLPGCPGDGCTVWPNNCLANQNVHFTMMLHPMRFIQVKCTLFPSSKYRSFLVKTCLLLRVFSHAPSANWSWSRKQSRSGAWLLVSWVSPSTHSRKRGKLSAWWGVGRTVYRGSYFLVY